ERRELLVTHAIALASLFVAATLMLFAGGGRDAGPSHHAFDAYEAAMDRLRAHGQQESQRHEAERRRMTERMRDQEALASAGQLTAGIVHEVRNGLGTILGYARIAERAPGAPDDAAEAGRHIREECETLEAIVRRFMEFVRTETLAVATVDLGRLLQRVV